MLYKKNIHCLAQYKQLFNLNCYWNCVSLLHLLKAGKLNKNINDKFKYNLANYNTAFTPVRCVWPLDSMKPVSPSHTSLNSTTLYCTSLQAISHHSVLHSTSLYLTLPLYITICQINLRHSTSQNSLLNFSTHH